MYSCIYFFLLLAKFLKCAAGIGLLSRKREASKMDVSTDTMRDVFAYLQNTTLQVVLNREALKELCYTFPKNTYVFNC